MDTIGDEADRFRDNIYFGLIRDRVIREVPDGPNRVLDIGCATGMTLRRLKELGKASVTVGIDRLPVGCVEAMDKYLEMDLNALDELPFEDGYFDVLLLADVLEHLLDPAGVVKRLLRYVSPCGNVVMSIPNIREYGVLWEISAKGRFLYKDAGILDKTHLRFFCKKDMLALLSEAGLDLLSISPRMSRRRTFLNRMSLGLMEEFLAKQYILVGKKRERKHQNT